MHKLRAQLDDQATICMVCGTRVKEKVEKRESAFFSGFFSLILPPLGFILSLIFGKKHRRKSKVCLRNSFIGLAIYVALLILLIFFWFFVLIGILT